MTESVASQFTSPIVTSRVPAVPSSMVKVSPIAYGASLVPSPPPAASVDSSSDVASSDGVSALVVSSDGVSSPVDSSAGVSTAVVVRSSVGSPLSRVSRKIPVPAMITRSASTAQPAQTSSGALADFFGGSLCWAKVCCPSVP